MSVVEGVLARVVVDDIDAALPVYAQLSGDGAVRRFRFREVELVLEGPGDAPNGPRMIARHHDGAVFEYIQPRGDT